MIVSDYLYMFEPYFPMLIMIMFSYLVKYVMNNLIVFGESNLGYVPPDLGAPKLNLDKHGMPKDYASYMWLTYKKVVSDESPNRRAFLNKGGNWEHPNFGLQMSMR